MSDEHSNDKKVDPMFVSLVVQLQEAAWIHMGKVANPASGKVERNLDAARGAIDMLGMLEEKTRGNLGQEEENLLRELLRQMRLNYVSEQKKPEQETAAPGEAAAAGGEEDGGDNDADKTGS